jgi:AcrR family transcriptional regulator
VTDTATTAELSLRERKKVQTRKRIAATALRLFDERGFDQVRVAEIAREAEVSEATVFNYFPTKEDLVYAGMETYEASLIDIVRHRPPGTGVVAAFRGHVLQPRGVLAHQDPAAVELVAQAARIIAGSGTLQTREQQLVDRTTTQLADLLAEERRAAPGDLRAWVVANALMGVNRGITRAVQRHALQSALGPTSTRRILDQARRALDELQDGLRDGPRRPQRRHGTGRHPDPQPV